MGTVATVVVVIAVPFMAGVGLGTARMPRIVRVAVMVAFPMAILVWLHGTNHNIVDVVILSAAVYLLIGGWFFGFWVARLLRLVRAANRAKLDRGQHGSGLIR